MAAKKGPIGVGKVNSLEELTAQSAPEKATLKASSIRRVTIKDLGKRLPIGSLVGDKLIKDFSTRRWKTRDDRELGKDRKDKDSASRYIGMVLRRMCPELGDFRGADYAGDGDLEKALIRLGQQHSGDIFYAYIQLRIEAIGNELPLQVTCGRCDHSFRFVGLLDTVECLTVDDPADLYWEFKLEDDCEIRGKNVEKFVMGPTYWSLMDEAHRVGRNGNSVNMEAIKIATIRSTIQYLGDDRANRVQLADVELDDLSKLDKERLISEINQHSLGPQMIIEGQCPKCNTEFSRAIDWEGNNFFSISSRS